MILDDGNIRFEILRSDAEVLEMQATYRPASLKPPMHFHPSQAEHFDVRRGALHFIVDGAAHTIAGGHSIDVPIGARHQAWNHHADQETVAVWQTRPALRSLEFFTAIYELQKRGKSLLGMARIASEFRREFVLASPPRIVQTCLFGLLAPLARVLGK